MVFTQNPSEPQIFALKDKSIFFQYQTIDDLLINLQSIHGIDDFSRFTESEKDKIMILRGRDDILSLTTSNEKSTELCKLNSTPDSPVIVAASKCLVHLQVYSSSKQV